MIKILLVSKTNIQDPICNSRDDIITKIFHKYLSNINNIVIIIGGYIKEGITYNHNVYQQELPCTDITLIIEDKYFKKRNYYYLDYYKKYSKYVISVNYNNYFTVIEDLALYFNPIYDSLNIQKTMLIKYSNDPIFKPPLSNNTILFSAICDNDILSTIKNKYDMLFIINNNYVTDKTHVHKLDILNINIRGFIIIDNNYDPLLLYEFSFRKIPIYKLTNNVINLIPDSIDMPLLDNIHELENIITKEYENSWTNSIKNIIETMEDLLNKKIQNKSNQNEIPKKITRDDRTKKILFQSNIK